MDTISALTSRRSIRKYTGEKLTDEQLNTILKAAWAAPVGRSRYESLHLTVIESPEVLGAFDAAAAQMFGNPNMHPLYAAPAFLLVSCKPMGEAFLNVEYSNAAIIAHNASLAAVELGLGQCLIWGSVAALNLNAEVLSKLELPEGFVPLCGVILGATEEKYAPREIPERITVNRI